jgi:hypothetical protein
MAVGGSALAGGFSASAATAVVPTMHVSSSIGLSNNQKISITGSGFTPNESSLVAVECDGLTTTAANCDVSSPVPLTVNASGDVAPTSFTVSTGPVGTGTCGTSATDSTCLVAIGEIATGTLVTVASISFASGPGVSVSPSTGLTYGQAVTLTGSNFKPGDSLYAVECLITATTAFECDQETAVPITASASGTLPSTTFTVRTGNIYRSDSCGTSPSDYEACVIEVATVTGGDKAFATIDFAVPAVAASPPPTATRVTASGVPGKTVAATIVGKNFTAVATITGGAGSTISVTGVSKSVVHVKIKESASAKKGTGTLVIHFKDGKIVRVKYSVT